MTAVDLPPWLRRPTTSRYTLPPSTTPTPILNAHVDPVSSPSCPPPSAEGPSLAALETAQPLYHQFKPLRSIHSHNAPHPPSPSSRCLPSTDIRQLTARFKAHMNQLFAPFEARSNAEFAQLEQQPTSNHRTIIPCQPHSGPPQSSHGCESPLKSTPKANVPCKRRNSDPSIHNHCPSVIFDLLFPPSSSSCVLYNHNFDASLHSPPCAYLFPQHANSHPISMRQSSIQVRRKFCGQYLHHYQDEWCDNKHQFRSTAQSSSHRTYVERCTDMTKLVRTWLQKIPDPYENNLSRTLQTFFT